MTNEELFIKAFNEANSLELSKYQNKDSFVYNFSKAFENKMNKLISKNNRIKFETRKRVSKALIAAIIAIIALFTGLMSVSASREKIVEFIERVFPTYIQITLSENSAQTPETIEKAYTLSYVPKGFELKQYQLEETSVFAIWENEKGEEIVFSQDILNIDFSMDNENNYKKIKLNGYSAHIYWDNIDCIIAWTDGEYWFTLNTPIRYKDDLVDMANNISEKN